MEETHPPVAVATDAVITINFYSAQPRIILGKRAHDPFQDRLVFPGGHFDPGIWSDEAGEFIARPETNIKHDLSLRMTTSRETKEEINVDIAPWDWQFLTELDAPDRDPRSDMRRISIAYWTNLEQLPDSIQAGDDLAGFAIVDLMSLTNEDMGFDHWQAIQLLQEKWLEYNLIWTRHPELGWVHACNLLNLENNYESRPFILYILHNDGRPQILFQQRSAKLPLSGQIKCCPFCQANLQLPPPVLPE